MASRRAGDTGALSGPVDGRAEAREELRTATKEFEAIFLYQMISAMRKTIGDGGLIEKSNGEEIFEGMLDEEWSRKLAGRHGSRGLAEVLYQQLSRQMGLEEDGPAAEPGPGHIQLPGAAQVRAMVQEGREGAEE